MLIMYSVSMAWASNSQPSLASTVPVWSRMLARTSRVSRRAMRSLATIKGQTIRALAFRYVPIEVFK